MHSLGELEVWREATEEELIQLATALNGQLHDVERRLERLHTEVHRIVCETPGAVEDKVARVHELLQEELPELDLGPTAQDASWLAQLKSRVADCERRIAELVHQRSDRRDVPGSVTWPVSGSPPPPFRAIGGSSPRGPGGRPRARKSAGRSREGSPPSCRS